MDVINVNAAVIDPTSLTLFQSGHLAQVVPVDIYEATLGCHPIRIVYRHV